MDLGDDASDEPTPEVAWRRDVARRVAAAYPPHAAVTTIVVAGSAGAGTADRWSDLEIDCYWDHPPDDRERRAPIETVGGRDAVVWPYDADEGEWSEDYRLEGLDLTVSNFTVETVERAIDAVLQEHDLDPVKHMRLAALQNGVGLRGNSQLAAWRARCATFPEPLVVALIARSLTDEALAGWAVRDALVSRGDLIVLHQLLARVEVAVLDTVAALNGVLRSHRLPKWQRSVIARCPIAPAGLAQRLDRIWSVPGDEALAEAERLLGETVDLARHHTSIDLADFERRLRERRRPAVHV